MKSARNLFSFILLLAAALAVYFLFNDAKGFVYWTWAFFIFFTGAAIGSYFNALSYRIHFFFYGPARKQHSIGKRIWLLSSRPSFCPDCKTPIKPLYLIPVFGYLLSRARCAQCKAPIHWGYFLGELYMGIAAVVINIRFLFLQRLETEFSITGASGSLEILQSLPWLLACGCIYIVIYIDKKHFSIDIWPLLAVSLFVLFGLWYEERELVYHLYVGGGAFVFFLVIFLFSGGRLGFGDVLLAFPLGLMIGPFWPVSFNGAFLGAVVWGVVHHYNQKLTKGEADMKPLMKTKLPLGTFLGAAHLLVFPYAYIFPFLQTFGI